MQAAAAVFVMRQKGIGPFEGRIDGGDLKAPLDPDALGGADELGASVVGGADESGRTSW